MNKAVYEDPDSLQLQEYRPKNGRDIVTVDEPPNIELVDCPYTYVDKKNFKGQDIKS
jgi:hypothetical protein